MNLEKLLQPRLTYLDTKRILDFLEDNHYLEVVNLALRECQDLEDKYDELSDKYDGLNSSYNDLDDEYSDKKDEHEEEIQELKEKIEELENKLKEVVKC
jgi:predicted  nucleic acid-binding Zn-ribbon protein